MSKVLIVKAHPLTKQESSTLALLDIFLTEYQKLHPTDEFEIVDVFQKDFPSIDEQVLIAMQTKHEHLTAKQKQIKQLIHQYTAQFLASDKIIIANPLWNYMVPSHLKQWIDTIVQSGETFAYTNNGKETYADGKKVLHLQSNGSPSHGNDLASKYLDEILQFIGISSIKHIYIDGKDIPALTDQAIQQAQQEALAYASQF